MKNEIKSVGHRTHGMATQRKWHPYQDYLDILLNSLFNYELDQAH